MLKMFCAVFSVFILTACQLKRPDGEACVLDVPNGVCYRLKVPETELGEWEYLGEKPIAEIDKHFAFSPEYIVELKDYIQKLRERYENKCK